MREYITSSAYETEQAGCEFAKNLSGRETVALDGDLGAGKTVFVKGIARGLGIEEEITSPTYTIVHEHEGGKYPLYHFDVYRIGDSDEMTDVGYYDYLGKGICIIEWASLIDDILPDDTIRISVERLGESERKITVGEGGKI